MMKRLEHERLRAVVMLALFAGLFVLDLVTPLSFANHILYATVILLAAASRFTWMLWAAGICSTTLTVIGGFLSPPLPDLPLWIPIGNRFFTIVIVWVLVWFALKRKQAESALRKVNEDLDEKVAVRTHELADVNR